MKVWIKMVVGLFLGILIGIYIEPDSTLLEPLRVAGVLFFKLFSFAFFPLVLFSGIRSIIYLRKNKRLFILLVKSIGYFLLLSAVGAAIGVVLGDVLYPGEGSGVKELESPVLIHYPGTSEFIREIVPESIFDFINSGYTVFPVLFVAFLAASGILLSMEDSEKFHSLIISIDETLHHLNMVVLEFLPVGIFTYAGYLMGFMTQEKIMPYLKLIMVIIGGTFIQIFIVQSLMVFFITKMNPFRFIHAVLPAGIMGFMSANRYTSYPVLVESMEKNLGAEREVTTFITSVGCAFSLSGSALASGVCTLYVAQTYGLELSVYLKIIIVLLITVYTLKLDGIKEGGLVLLSVVLSQIVKLPQEGYTLILGISLIIYQIETVADITGNACVSYILSKSEKAVKPVNLRYFI